MKAHAKSLDTLLDALQYAIISHDLSQALPYMKVNSRLQPEQQLAIYAEGYRMRLVEAIRSDYPALLHYLGAEAFDALALHYIEASPPYHFNLDRYPHGFIGVVYDEAQDDFAADLAMLEGSIARIFMLGESPALSSEALVGITTEELAQTLLTMRTASCLLRLRYPADVYMTQAREGLAPARPKVHEQYLCLVRHQNEVKRHVLDVPQFVILSHLRDGMRVGDALEAAVEEYPQLVADIARIVQNGFSYWISNGFFQSAAE